MAQPYFSIIVPVYKAEEYLRRCVDSVLAQTFTDWELILVDDGSPDGCGGICDAYASDDSRIRVIHQQNRGNVLARRAGHDAATGRYLAHLDSDDYWETSLLASAAEKFDRFGVEAVVFGFEQVGMVQKRCPVGIAEGLYADQGMQTIRDSLIQGETGAPVIYNCLWSMIMERERFLLFLEQVPTVLYRGEDLAATAPALAACASVYVMGSCPYFYRQTENSIMHTSRGDELQQALILAEYLQGALGSGYEEKLSTYVVREFYPVLRQLAQTNDKKGYAAAVKELLTPQLQVHLKRGRCGRSAHWSDRILFFILRNGWFGLFRTIVLRK